MKNDLKYYCNFHRGITQHIVLQEKKEIACIGYKEHPKIQWCRKCGERIDTGKCQEKGARWHKPELST